jgi:hypothetical protein
MEKLKPCPFCQTSKDLEITTQFFKLTRPSRNGFCVVCWECDLWFGYDTDYGGIFITKQKVTEAWNKRVSAANKRD